MGNAMQAPPICCKQTPSIYSGSIMELLDVENDGGPGRMNEKVKSLIGRLSGEKLSEFISFRRNEDRIRFVADNYSLFESEISFSGFGTGSASHDSKSATVAGEHRAKGNKLFGLRRFKEAIASYNRAIIHAPWRCNPMTSSRATGSEVESREGLKELPLAFANRSAALFHIKRYRESRDDILRALRSNLYPEENLYKMYERLARCYMKLDRPADALKAVHDGIASIDVVSNNDPNWSKTSGKKIDEFNVLKAECERRLQLENRSEITNENSNSDTTIGNQPVFENTTIYNCKDVTNSIFDNRINPKETNTSIPPMTEIDDTCRVTKSFNDSIDVKTSETVGRYTVAKMPIKVGDVLLEMLPFSAIMYPVSFDFRCYNCMAVIGDQLYPCERCCRVAYCSEDCSKSNWEGCHWSECGFMDWLTEKWVGKLGHLAYRILIDAGFDHVMSKFRRSHRADDNERSRADDNERARSSYARIVDSLIGHEADRSWLNEITFCSMSFLLTQLAKQTGWLPANESNSRASEMATIAAILRHLQLIQCNAYQISEMHAVTSADCQSSNGSAHRDNDGIVASGRNDFLGQYRSKCLGLGLYETLSMVNHSCDSNVELIFTGIRCIMRAVRDIGAGEEVMVDYGSLFFAVPKPRRQEQLREEYFFDCGCEACDKNWPLWEDLPSTRLTFRCQRCRLPIQLDAQKCPSCKSPSSEYINNSLKRLDKTHRECAAAMSDAMLGRLDEAIPRLETHLSTMQELLCQPWREFYNCQATLMQCYRLKGNIS